MEEKQDVLLEMKDLSISFYNKTGEIQAVRVSVIHYIRVKC